MFTKSRVGALITASGLALTGAVFVVPPVSAHTTGIHDNCTELHKKWEHGVGRRDARDRTTSGDPVTHFHRSNRAYP